MSDWKPTFRFHLVAQEAPRVQSSLFMLEPRPEPCEHLNEDLQETIDGYLQHVCVACGEVTRTFVVEATP